MKYHCPVAMLISAAGLFVIGGCGAPPPPLPPVSEPMSDVVREINANNEQVPTLWATHYYEASIVDENKKPHFVNGDGALLYRRPLGMRIVGNKPVAGTVFEIGSTEEKYWFKIVPELNTMWYGDYANLGKPCVRPVPIQPNMVLEVLGLGTFNTDFTAFPAPVMRYNPDKYADVYMFDWVVPAANPSRYVVEKEIWYDRATKRPTRVLLFDADGRTVLRATLGKHQQVPIQGQPEPTWPWVATDYKLYFPENGSKISFTLSDMVLCKNGVPCRKGIVFPGSTREDAGVERVIQLDEGCGGK
jgi:hypothetical protein